VLDKAMLDRVGLEGGDIWGSHYRGARKSTLWYRE
jgi:hypothetical protein